MKALVFKDIGKIALEEVKDPEIEQPTDALVKLTMTTICGTDLHFIRGTVLGFEENVVLGHEGVGVVEKIGSHVSKFKVGDRVVIPSTISCGNCEYCNKEHYSMCDKANPNGPQAGTAHFGSPRLSGSFNGMQAEKVRVPFADHVLIKIPDSLTDEQMILVSDVAPTAYFGVDLANVTSQDTVAVFGCGPIGQLVIACLKLRNPQKIYAIDTVPARLEMAKKQGAEILDFNTIDIVKTILTLTKGKGVTKVIDAVGVEAVQPAFGSPGFMLNMGENLKSRSKFKKEVEDITIVINPVDGNWIPGNAPSQVLEWAIQILAKTGTLSIIGVYPPTLNSFPIGIMMNKNLTIKAGVCDHSKYIPLLIPLIESGQLDCRPFITHTLPFENIIEAYKNFDKRKDNWIKVIFTIR